MRRWIGAVLLLAGCSSGASGGADTTVPPTTAEAATTVADTTTTVATMSRDALVAVETCIDAMTQYIGVGLSSGLTRDADEAKAACEDADIQVGVDGRTDIAVLISQRLYELAKLRADVALAELQGFDPDQDALLQFDNGANSWAGQVRKLLP